MVAFVVCRPYSIHQYVSRPSSCIQELHFTNFTFYIGERCYVRLVVANEICLWSVCNVCAAYQRVEFRQYFA